MKRLKHQQSNQTDFPENEESELLDSFLAGNENAFTFIYKKYVDDIFEYGVGLGFDDDTLKDAIHDIFYKLYCDRKKLKNIQNLKSFLFRMLRNRLFDLYRISVKSDDISQYEMSFSAKSTILDEIINEEDKQHIQAHIDELLDRLTKRQREAVYLRFMQELDYEEIGELLEMTPPAVRKLISRAIQRMREE